MSKSKETSETNKNDEIDNEAKPIVSHLVELRTRLLWVIGIMMLGTTVSFIFVDGIYSFLVQPLANAMNENDTNRLIYTGLTEAFFTYMKVAFFSGIFITFPVLLLQLWGCIKMRKMRFCRFCSRPLFYSSWAVRVCITSSCQWLGRFSLAFNQQGRIWPYQYSWKRG